VKPVRLGGRAGISPHFLIKLPFFGKNILKRPVASNRDGLFVFGMLNFGTNWEVKFYCKKNRIISTKSAHLASKGVGAFF
jgi:hypothetical protein